MARQFGLTTRIWGIWGQTYVTLYFVSQRRCGCGERVLDYTRLAWLLSLSHAIASYALIVVRYFNSPVCLVCTYIPTHTPVLLRFVERKMLYNISRVYSDMYYQPKETTVDGGFLWENDVQLCDLRGSWTTDDRDDRTLELYTTGHTLSSLFCVHARCTHALQNHHISAIYIDTTY